MPLVSPDALHAALETVIDPEIRKPVTELGMVESVSADDEGQVAVTILLTVAACPLKDTLTKDTTAALAYAKFIDQGGMKLMEHWALMTTAERSALGEIARNFAARAKR